MSKNIQKIKKLLSSIIFSQNGMRLGENGWDGPRKGEKNFSPEFCSYSTPVRKFRKKISKKIQKIKKLLSNIIFSQDRKSVV